MPEIFTCLGNDRSSRKRKVFLSYTNFPGWGKKIIEKDAEGHKQGNIREELKLYKNFHCCKVYGYHRYFYVEAKVSEQSERIV